MNVAPFTGTFPCERRSLPRNYVRATNSRRALRPGLELCDYCARARLRGACPTSPVYLVNVTWLHSRYDRGIVGCFGAMCRTVAIPMPRIIMEQICHVMSPGHVRMFACKLPCSRNKRETEQQPLLIFTERDVVSCEFRHRERARRRKRRWLSLRFPLAKLRDSRVFCRESR